MIMMMAFRTLLKSSTLVEIQELAGWMVLHHKLLLLPNLAVEVGSNMM